MSVEAVIDGKNIADYTVLRSNADYLKLLENVNAEQLQQSLNKVEAQLASLSPGDLREKRLLQQRATLRQLIREKMGENIDLRNTTR